MVVKTDTCSCSGSIQQDQDKIGWKAPGEAVNGEAEMYWLNMSAAGQECECAPVALIADLEVLAGMGPVEGGHVVVGHPHEALGAQHRLDWRVPHLRSLACLCILRHRHPPQHCVPQPANQSWLQPVFHDWSNLVTLSLPLPVLLSHRHTDV